MPTFRYRVYEPETPRDLPLELVQEWESPRHLRIGTVLTMPDEAWRIVAIEDESDPAYEGRVYFEFAARPPEDRPLSQGRD